MLNGETRTPGSVFTLKSLIADITGRDLTDEGQPVDGQRLGVAVAVNGEVVPRLRWAQMQINEGDDVEVLTAVQGG